MENSWIQKNMRRRIVNAAIIIGITGGYLLFSIFWLFFLASTDHFPGEPITRHLVLAWFVMVVLVMKSPVMATITVATIISGSLWFLLCEKHKEEKEPEGYKAGFWERYSRLRRALPHIALALGGLSVALLLPALILSISVLRWLYANGVLWLVKTNPLVIVKGTSALGLTRMVFFGSISALVAFLAFLTHLLEPEWGDFVFEVKIVKEAFFSEPMGKMTIEGNPTFTYTPCGPDEIPLDESRSIMRGDDFAGEVGFAVSADGLWLNQTKVFALEAWLFDKVDIRITTKVFLSPFALQDAQMREIANRHGEIVEDPGKPVVLETATMRVTFELDGEPEYMEVTDDLPAEAAFKSLSVRITVEDLLPATEAVEAEEPEAETPPLEEAPPDEVLGEVEEDEGEGFPWEEILEGFENLLVEPADQKVPDWLDILKGRDIITGQPKEVHLTTSEMTLGLPITDFGGQVLGQFVTRFVEEVVNGEYQPVAIEVFLKDGAEPDTSPPAIVIPSQYAASDEWLRTQLSHRGKVLEEPHEVGRLETARMIATVVLLPEEVVYAAGTDGLPEKAAFESVNIRMQVSVKKAA